MCNYSKTKPLCHTVFLHGMANNSMETLVKTVYLITRRLRRVRARNNILFCLVIDILILRGKQ